MILLGRSQDTEGLVWGIDDRALWTRWVGSFMKCFAALVLAYGMDID